MTAPTPDPGALLDRLEEARKAIAREFQRGTGAVNRMAIDAADDVLALPEVADLLRLARDGLALRDGVERLAEDYEAGVSVGVIRSEVVDRLRAVVADTSGEA